MSTWRRIGALSAKEAIQLVRDRATLGMLLGVPLLQVLLFGFAIELVPRTLAVTVVATTSERAASVLGLLGEERGNILIHETRSLNEAQQRLRRGEALIVLNADTWPVSVLIDASDPVLAAQASAAIERLEHRLAAETQELDLTAPALHVERLFNPEARTQPYLVSGLLGLILTMTLVMMSALSLARERERGTLEGLIALRVRPLELCIGKLAPYAVFGFLQGSLVLIVARLAFNVSVEGSWLLLAGAGGLFAIANLALGFLFSSLASAQMPAMQMTFFFFLPSSLLSGFMFPFSAMPAWAQAVGQVLPLTHFLRLARGILLRRVDATYVVQEALPIAVFAAVIASAAIWACHRSMRAGPG